MSRPSSRSSRGRKSKNLHVEALEDRSLMSANTISGYVFYDVNSNGIFDVGEQPIANSQIELRNLNDVVVGTATTNAAGYYEFVKDQTTTGLDKTLTKTVTFPPTQTNFQLSGMLDQFDPSLGVLQSIEIRHDGSITSEIKVENFSTDSTSDISGTVSGNLTLTAPGVNDLLAISGYAGAFTAAKYDGNTDFTGLSGNSFGEKTASGTKTLTLTGNAINAYIGTGQVTVTESAVATSNASGGGNLDVRVRSTGASSVTVVYHYKEFGPLTPGSYKLVQTAQPTGYTDGMESQQGVPIPNTIGTDFIVVGLLAADVPNNNFGELKPTGISGHVWHDANNDGIRDANEALIPGAVITLTGPSGVKNTTTDANGYYEFINLAPGTYTVTETQPTNYLDGKDVAGTKGGTVVNNALQDQIQGITIQSGDGSENNDFGELKPASIAGHVYFDANNNGVREAGELPISGVNILLTGFSDQGPVSFNMATNAQGEYKFVNLRPGTYAITESQPLGYNDGKDTIGTPGGTTTNDAFSDILLSAGVDGVNNDFGEIKKNTPPPGNPLPLGVPLLPNMPVFTKNQLLVVPTLVNVDPAFRGQMAFVVGTTFSLTGKTLNLDQTLGAVDTLRAGTTQKAFVEKLWASSAHRAAQANAIYKDVLDRAPTAAEKAQVIADLRAGTSELAIKESLYISAEYGQLHPSSQALAAGLYEDILNEVPGVQALDTLVQSMGNQPLQDVVHGLLTSDQSLANLIDDAYRTTVRRAATAAEIQTWTPQLKAGSTTLDAIAIRLLASQEFYQLAYNKIV